MKLFICVLIATVAVLVAAQEAPASQEDYDNFQNYDDTYDYDQLIEGEKLEAELDKLHAENYFTVKEDIDELREKIVEDADALDDKNPVAGIDEYLLEDNRDGPKDIQEDKNLDGSFQDDDNNDAPFDNDDTGKKENDHAGYDLLWGDDSVAPLPVPEADPEPEDKDILDESQKIFENDADQFEEEIKQAIGSSEILSDNQPDDKILDETKRILEETDDSFNNDDQIKAAEEVIDETNKKFEDNNDAEDHPNNNESLSEDESIPVIIDEVPVEKIIQENVVEINGQDKESVVEETDNTSNIKHDVIVEEDTVDKVYADLNSDLDKLLDTLDKLSDSSDNDEKIEEVFDKLDDHFFKEDDNNVEGSEELVDDVKGNADYVEVDFDKILEDIKNEDDLKADNSAADVDLNVLLNDELNEPNPDDAFERDVESLSDVNAKPILFLDAIVDVPKNTESIENTKDDDNNVAAIDASIEAKEPSKFDTKLSKEQTNEFETVDVNSLNSEELEGLVKQFSNAHSEVLDVRDTFNDNTAEHIKLNVDTPDVVTSPNYPSPYPTNTIKDWVFDGEGMGIELNITDFLVNGALGDYLLVKPAQEAPASQEDYDNFQNYDDTYDYDQLIEGEKLEAELDKLHAENYFTVKEDIDELREKIVEDADALDDKNPVAGIDEYLLEDNRDGPKDIQEDKNLDGSFQDDDNNDAPFDNDDTGKKENDHAGYDSVAPLPVPEADPEPEDKDNLDESQKIFENDADQFEEEIKQAIGSSEILSDNQPDDKILDETKRILEETDDSFNNDDQIKAAEEVIDETNKKFEENNDAEDHPNNNESLSEDESKPVIIDEVPVEKIIQENVVEINGQDKESVVEETDNTSNIKHDVIVEEDTVDKVYADLNADLDKLLDTLDKLSDSSDNDEKIEEVFDKLDDHFFKEDDNNVEGSEELVDDVKGNADYVEVDFDKILEDIKNEDDLKADNSAADVHLNVLLNDELNEPNPDDAFERDVESLSDVNAEPILFLDAIVDVPKNTESIENTKDDDNDVASIDASIEAKEPSKFDTKLSKEQTNEFETVDVNNLNSEELEGLVKQFSNAHSEVLDVRDTFNDNVAEHIKLNVDTPDVVTSPNYPSPYPTNTIKDWVFDGEGMGIELNITDFLVNGALGDYLLVKPGGVDDSGDEGLIFTYRLNSEKRFRFTDVDRLFVRFESKSAMIGRRGFQFSVKMIAPLPEEPEPIPEPEPVVDEPHSRHTIYLATAIPQFNDLRGRFTQLLADMAEEYISENSIEPGLNTTAEVTQITSVSTCPVTWPSYRLCAAVTFGIPLSYEEGEDEMLDGDALQDMWNTYRTRDPYALRLRQMGIAEFEQPSSSVLTAWLVIASGVVISMVMLAFVLWRFSCFEDYTRMKSYSDTDSLHNEKRGLDLYPTPHQTLPPLFAENEYKWPENDDTTRVDMGGLANKSYARDMYDFESDEETAPRDRPGAVISRDTYDGSKA